MIKISKSVPSTRIVLGTIVIMDDDPRTVKFFDDVVKEYGGRTAVAPSAAEVLELSRTNGTRYFCLDIDMGEGRAREGLHALRQLKREWPEVYVVILSNHGELERASKKTGADYFKAKTKNRMADVHVAIIEMVRHAQEVANRLFREVLGEEEEVRDSESDWKDDVELFLSLAADPELKGKMVAIVEGRVVASGFDESEVDLLARESFPDSDRLVARVGEGLQEIDLTRPLGVQYQGAAGGD